MQLIALIKPYIKKWVHSWLICIGHQKHWNKTKFLKLDSNRISQTFGAIKYKYWHQKILFSWTTKRKLVLILTFSQLQTHFRNSAKDRLDKKDHKFLPDKAKWLKHQWLNCLTIPIRNSCRVQTLLPLPIPKNVGHPQQPVHSILAIISSLRCPKKCRTSSCCLSAKAFKSSTLSSYQLWTPNITPEATSKHATTQRINNVSKEDAQEQLPIFHTTRVRN